jgi:hypothetical protein
MIKSCAQVTKIFDFDQNHVQVEGTHTSPYKVMMYMQLDCLVRRYGTLIRPIERLTLSQRSICKNRCGSFFCVCRR